MNDTVTFPSAPRLYAGRITPTGGFKNAAGEPITILPGQALIKLDGPHFALYDKAQQPSEETPEAPAPKESAPEAPSTADPSDQPDSSDPSTSTEESSDSSTDTSGTEESTSEE